MSILEGSVVFVDDDYMSDGNTHAKAFYDEVKASGRPIAAYSGLPELSDLDNWDGLALAVIDWDLTRSESHELGATVMEEVVTYTRERLIAFLQALLERYFCPVFIVSGLDPEAIRGYLIDAPDFPDEVVGGRVRILPKEDGDLLPKLERIVTDDPVLAILRTWEKEYQAAKNLMFIDLAGWAKDWPAHLIYSSRMDGVDEHSELLETLYANLRQRVNPVEFDLASIDLTDVDSSVEAARRVVHGRRVLPGNRLPPLTIMPGDLFAQLSDDDPDNALWLNLTPACYSVIRRGGKTIDPRLHLIRGVPIKVPSDSTTKESVEFERQRQAGRRSVIIDFLLENSAYKFMFDTLERRFWSEIRDKRTGRLLSPYITDAQLRHGNYLTSEGLPRVRPELYRE